MSISSDLPAGSQTPTSAAALAWHGADALPSPLPAGLGDWLTTRGSLTRRLRGRCGTDFRLEVLREGWLEPPAPEAAMLGIDGGEVRERRIRMHCADHPCLYAHTLAPRDTLQAHPWLARLGDRPLGEVLEGRRDVERSPFEYVTVGPGVALFDEAVADTGVSAAHLWARRSVFSIGSARVLVCEVFLPGIAACEPR